MDNRYTRTEYVLGADAVEKLKNSSVLLFGLGGVGSYCAEALIRAGIGRLTIVDNDTVDVTNINRQLPALHSTIGKLKTDVMEARLSDIAPDAEIIKMPVFVSPETIDMFDFAKYDYVVDAIDNVTAKVLIAERCSAVNSPLLAAMGTGNKRDASRFKIGDIYKTSVCPLARVMRRELKKRNIEHLRVLWSDEEPYTLKEGCTPGSLPFVPPVAGLMMAGDVILTLCGENE